MARPLAHPISEGWPVLAFAGWAAINLALVWPAIPAIGGDWVVFWYGSQGYAMPEYIFPPLTSLAWRSLVVPLGPELSFAVSAGLHTAALFPLRREPLLLAVVLGSAGFWHEVLIGNVSLFGIVLGWLAVRGSDRAALAYWGWFVLFPKPVFLPLAIWLVWRRPIRRQVAALVAVAGIATLATGEMVAWLTHTLAVTADYRWRMWDFGPTRIFGPAWLIVGLPLGGWLLMRGRPGWAGVAMTPYLVPTYWLVLLWELHAGERLRAVPDAKEVEGACYRERRLFGVHTYTHRSDGERWIAASQMRQPDPALVMLHRWGDHPVIVTLTLLALFALGVIAVLNWSAS